MPHLHFKRTAHKSGGGTASARIGYITGQGVKDATATAQINYISEGREDLIYARTKNLPAWANENPHTYFRAAERYERPSPNDARLRGVAFEEWKISLPQELSHAKNKDLMRDLVDAIAGNTLPITYAFHDPQTLDGTQQQPHLHLLISARINDKHLRPPEQHFKRYNRANPEKGGAQKSPGFWHKGAIHAHRALISDLVNLHLEWAGIASRVHPDSLEQRELPRRPEPKLLPSESRAYKEHGIISPRVQEVLDIRQERASGIAREAAQAKTYWEGRKTTLGITPTMSKKTQREAVTQARAHRQEQAPPTRPVVDLDKTWNQPILGHRLSKIYHTPGQHSYGKVNPKHQVRFTTERDALTAGYRRAKNDHYGAGSAAARKPWRPPSTLARRMRQLAQQIGRVKRGERKTGRGRLDIEINPDVHGMER